MDKNTGLKIAGVGFTVLAAIVNIGAGVVNNATQKKQIEEAANKAVADLLNKEG